MRSLASLKDKCDETERRSAFIEAATLEIFRKRKRIFSIIYFKFINQLFSLVDSNDATDKRSKMADILMPSVPSKEELKVKLANNLILESSCRMTKKYLMAPGQIPSLPILTTTHIDSASGAAASSSLNTLEPIQEVEVEDTAV